MALWAKREGEGGGGGPFYIFNFLKKNQNEKGAPSLSTIQDSAFMQDQYLVFHSSPPLLRRGGGLGVWVGKPASFPLFYNEKGGDLLFYLTLVELRSTNACLKKDMFFLNRKN
nr:hypothetical protein [Morchella crassipes]